MNVNKVEVYLSVLISTRNLSSQFLIALEQKRSTLVAKVNCEGRPIKVIRPQKNARIDRIEKWKEQVLRRGADHV